jgi:hypothetical protein
VVGAIGKASERIAAAEEEFAAAGSPIGQRQVCSVSSKRLRRWPIGMMLSISSGVASAS